MRGSWILQTLVLATTFVVALIMEITPWSADFQGFRPAWLVLVLFYWVMALPNRVSIGWAFVVGLVWDLSLGSLMGVHALTLSIFTFIIASNYLVLRNLSLWLQSMIAVLSVIVIDIAIFLLELFMHSARFNPQELVGAVLSGILWPWVFLLLRALRRKFQMR